MAILIVASRKSELPVPLIYNLGDHALVITDERSGPLPSEITADGAIRDAVRLDDEETYKLYQCLHALLFQPKRPLTDC